MPRRSPSPGSFRRYHDSDDGDRYRSRRGDYRRNADRESRDGHRDRGASERDTRRRGYHDDDRQRRDDRDDRRRRERERGYDNQDKAKPNFAPSGLLAAATNTVKNADGTSTLLKYNEPPEARKPLVGWRLYVFKDGKQFELLHIHRQSAYLIGRDRTVTDIPLEHPSCSKQHAVIQYRLVQQKDESGDSKRVIKPFVIDLESTNGTHVNGEAIPTSRYYELKVSDVLKFGTSSREYVLLHDDVS
ncbi:SMAD/FHA domain-containing protein [Russula compacta]|nr:SMAD/FHA domain-containing protein [Russula compacta]